MTATEFAIMGFFRRYKILPEEMLFFNPADCKMSPDDNGDIKLVPMLEIEAPYYSSNLPSAADLRNYGIFVKDSKFWTWFSEIKMNIIKRRAIIINLLDETGAPKMVWTLHNAWPTKVTGTDLKSEGNEVAVESIELAYETLEVKAA